MLMQSETCAAYWRFVTMTDYTPIDCALYSEYEAAIVQHMRLRLSFRDRGGQLRIEVVRPVDLKTRHQEEFLLAETRDRNKLELRLDQIIKAEVL
jgi:Rho-binding antiterminator